MYVDVIKKFFYYSKLEIVVSELRREHIYKFDAEYSSLSPDH